MGTRKKTTKKAQRKKNPPPRSKLFTAAELYTTTELAIKCADLEEEQEFLQQEIRIFQGHLQLQEQEIARLRKVLIDIKLLTYPDTNATIEDVAKILRLEKEDK